MAKHLTTDEKANLSAAIGYSLEQGKVFRDNRVKLMKEAVGYNYSDNGAKDKVPINLMELALNIYLQRLVAQNPKVAITTKYPQLKEIVTRFDLAGNHLIEEIALGETLETIITDAMFSKGIAKIYLNRTSVEVGGVLHDSGQATVDAISLDDWFEDMTVDKNENGQFEGNYWYATIEEAMKIFPGTKKEDFAYRDEETTTDNTAHAISEGSGTQREEFKRTVRFMDIWLKKQNRIIQAVASKPSDDFKDPMGKVLKEFDWKGPENGPYRKLGFGKVSGNTMPVAPAMHWYDLHSLSNRLFRKLGRQADRQKTITGVRPGADKDGNTVLKASDGEMVKLDDPRNVNEFKVGGIDQPTLAFVLFLKDTYSYMAGNLDMLGGLGPQSETLGQDQLLSASASMRIQKMQKEVTNFTTAVLQDLMFYLWYDPDPNQQDVTKTIPGFESIAINVPFKPEDREGDYLQYNIKMEPYSMQHQSPESKLQGIRTILMEMVQPLLPMMEQQGVTLNVEKLFRTIAKLSNIAELDDIIEYTNPSLNDQPVGSSPNAPGKPAVTTRTNIRRNIPGATNQGKSQVLQQALLGANPQKSEVASLSRASA